MKFHETILQGVFLIEPEPIADERGFFARTFCRQEFVNHGLSASLDQCSVSFNKKRGTLRGMHFQLAPHDEIKLVRCTMGAIFDVVLDLRQDSQTYKKWIGVELTSENRKMLYIPPGCAHGFETLVDNTEVFYQIQGMFVPAAARGVLWNDPAFAIQWPIAAEVISEKDQKYAEFL
jgi:dTDP-4-dehydrorhamnose 3,5-epimerase